MCQLFGLNSHEAVSPAFLLKGFYCRGGGTDHHADGWGLAHFEGTRAKVVKQEFAAFNNPQLAKLVNNTNASHTVMAHIRKATVGSVALQNTHPFVRTLWGQEWVFAHNGDLKKYRASMRWPFTARGDTDSEQAFCDLLNHLWLRFGAVMPKVNVLADAIKQWADDAAQFGTLNFMLSNGSHLISYCTSDLHWAQRANQFSDVALVDFDRNAEFNRYSVRGEKTQIIATQPLTVGENWQAMRKGELRVFSEGQVVLTRDAVRQADSRFLTPLLIAA